MQILFLMLLPFFCFSFLSFSLRGADKISHEQRDSVLKQKEKEPSVDFHERGWVKINDYCFSVEIARYSKQHARGLMFREKLDHDAGMLFIFPDSKIRSFWMKNTLIPLSLAYITSDGRIASIHRMTPLDENPVLSKEAVQYVLEVNHGRFKALKIKEGMKIQWGINP